MVSGECTWVRVISLRAANSCPKVSASRIFVISLDVGYPGDRIVGNIFLIYPAFLSNLFVLIKRPNPSLMLRTRLPTELNPHYSRLGCGISSLILPNPPLQKEGTIMKRREKIRKEGKHLLPFRIKGEREGILMSPFLIFNPISPMPFKSISLKRQSKSVDETA